MIRLFRKIRHQLLSEDKYSTYVLYAAGEMLSSHLITVLENLEDDRSQLLNLIKDRQEFMDAYLSIVVEEIRFLELRQNTHTEAMESELWRNEFVMPNAVLKYKIIIEKGEELSLEINEYLAS